MSKQNYGRWQSFTVIDPSAGTIAVVWRGAISEKMTSALRKRTRDDNNVSY